MTKQEVRFDRKGESERSKLITKEEEGDNKQTNMNARNNSPFPAWRREKLRTDPADVTEMFLCTNLHYVDTWYA